jgi:ribosomal protein L37AE/L43A
VEILTLLDRARRQGLDVFLDGERLVVRGPRRAEALAQQILARKAAAIAGLRSARPVERPATDDAGCADGPLPSVARCSSCDEPDFVSPQAGIAWRCARCGPSDPPPTEIDGWPRIGQTAPFEAEPSASCYACGATACWRLKAGGPWVCRRCHPPLVAADLIETVGEVAL